MSYFFDSSAIAKRYVFEPGTPWIRAVCSSRTRPSLYLAGIAQVEVVAAIRRTRRIQGLHHSWADALVNMYMRDLRHDYQLLSITPSVLDIATLLCNRHADVTILRSLDAIQLACALTVHAVDHEVALVVSDPRMKHIAELEGLRVVDPAYP